MKLIEKQTTNFLSSSKNLKNAQSRFSFHLFLLFKNLNFVENSNSNLIEKHHTYLMRDEWGNYQMIWHLFIVSLDVCFYTKFLSFHLNVSFLDLTQENEKSKKRSKPGLTKKIVFVTYFSLIKTRSNKLPTYVEWVNLKICCCRCWCQRLFFCILNMEKTRTIEPKNFLTARRIY